MDNAISAEQSRLFLGIELQSQLIGNLIRPGSNALVSRSQPYFLASQTDFRQLCMHNAKKNAAPRLAADTPCLHDGPGQSRPKYVSYPDGRVYITQQSFQSNYFPQFKIVLLVY
jgi:hypothetical protein